MRAQPREAYRVNFLIISYTIASFRKTHNRVRRICAKCFVIFLTDFHVANYSSKFSAELRISNVRYFEQTGMEISAPLSFPR